MTPEPASAKPVVRASRRGLLGFFQPAPPAPVTLTDPEEIAAKYRRWQTRVLFFSIVGYATFYFVRKNLGIAMPFMEKDLGITKENLGLFLTLHGIIYGVSKFANGFLADRANACVFMSTALLASALLNIWFGLSSTVVAFGLVWMLNGWFQGMGFPPCARLIANWFPPKQLATKFSIWNYPTTSAASDCFALRISRQRISFRGQLAALFFCSGGDRDCRRRFALVHAPRHAALGRAAGI